MSVKSVTIVTGGSQGMREATALRLARDFSTVALVALSKNRLEATASRAKSAGAEGLVFALHEPQASEAVVSGTLERFGRIDAFLNVPGAVPQIDLFEMTDAQLDDGMALKFHGARRLTIRAWEALKATHSPGVFISGSAPLGPKPGFAAVVAINAGIIALAKAFAGGGIKEGIQRSSWPCYDSTPAVLLREVGACSQSCGGGGCRSSQSEQGSLVLEPEDVADLMGHRVSPAANWMTDASLRMDGGKIKAV